MRVVTPIEDVEDAAPLDFPLTFIRARPSLVSFQHICRSLSQYESQLELLSAVRDVLKSKHNLGELRCTMHDVY